MPKLKDISEVKMLAVLRRQYPEFFKDKKMQTIAAILVVEFQDDLKCITPIQRAGFLAGIIAKMYQMGAAAVQSVANHDKTARGMDERFIENWKRDNKST